MLRYNLNECLPRDISHQIPQKCRELTQEIYWVPQTMGEQVWEIFKFNDMKNKEQFISLLPESIKSIIDRNMTDQDYEKWCFDSPKWYLPENRVDRTK